MVLNLQIKCVNITLSALEIIIAQTKSEIVSVLLKDKYS